MDSSLHSVCVGVCVRVCVGVRQCVFSHVMCLCVPSLYSGATDFLLRDILTKAKRPWLHWSQISNFTVYSPAGAGLKGRPEGLYNNHANHIKKDVHCFSSGARFQSMLLLYESCVMTRDSTPAPRSVDPLEVDGQGRRQLTLFAS